MLQRLKTEHRQILRIINRLETTLLPEADGEWRSIAEARWELRHILLAHFAYKIAFVYSALATSGRPKTVAVGRRLAPMCSEIRMVYELHEAVWDAAAAQADWSAFRRSALDVIRQLRQLIDVEQSDLFHFSANGRRAPALLLPPAVSESARR